MRRRDKKIAGPSKKRDKLARAMLKPINTAAIILMGVFTAVWGFWLFNPFWSVFEDVKIYEVMDFFPEWFWGSIAIAVGVLMVHGVLKNSYKSLTTGALIGWFHWTFVSILFFIGDYHNTDGPTAAMVAIYCGFIWLNIRVNKEIITFGK